MPENHEYNRYPHKDSGLTLAESVHYCINQQKPKANGFTAQEELQQEMAQLRFSLDRHARFIALLVQLLAEEGPLNKEKIIDLLDRTVDTRLLHEP